MDLLHFIYQDTCTFCVDKTVFFSFTQLMFFLFTLGGQNVDPISGGPYSRFSFSAPCSLMLACYAGHLDVVKYLRRHGASWDARDLGGCTALHWAADGGHCPVIDWMIKDGCEVWPSLLPC